MRFVNTYSGGIIMRRGILVPAILILGLTLLQNAGLYAQVYRDARTGQDRIHGRIQVLDKVKSTMSVYQPETYSAVAQLFQVAYNDKTAVTLMGKPAKIDDLKKGLQVVAVGKSEKNILNASQIDIRTEK
jgi:hypothetical protein